MAGYAEFRIRRDRRLRMARHFDFRNDGDVALGGVFHDVANLILRVEAAVSRGRSDHMRRRAPRADLGELRIFLDLDAPALVVGEMPVHHVEFVDRHVVDEFLDEFRRLEMTRGIEHESAPGEARIVFDVDAAHARIAGREQLPQRDRAVEQSVRRARDDGDAIARDVHFVAFVGRIAAHDEIRIDAERNRIARIGAAERTHVEMDAARACEQVGEIARDTGRFRVSRLHVQARRLRAARNSRALVRRSPASESAPGRSAFSVRRGQLCLARSERN